jgi:hypothetical protein
MTVVSLAMPAWAQHPPDVCAEVSVRNGPDGEPGDEFQALEVVDLHFLVRLRGELAGEHVLELCLDTPNGHLYEVRTSPVTADPSRDQVLVPVQGYPDPLPLQYLQNRDGAQEAAFRLPVAGTLIVSNSLYGQWGVRVHLDGSTIMCSGTESFALQPPRGAVVFVDGFEIGDTSAWSQAVP